LCSLLYTSWMKTRPAQKLLVRVKFTGNPYRTYITRINVNGHDWNTCKLVFLGTHIYGYSDSHSCLCQPTLNLLYHKCESAIKHCRTSDAGCSCAVVKYRQFTKDATLAHCWHLLTVLRHFHRSVYSAQTQRAQLTFYGDVLTEGQGRNCPRPLPLNSGLSENRRKLFSCRKFWV